jgi:hypothetical protein
MNHAISALKFKIIKEFLELGWAVLLSDVDVILVQVAPWAQLINACPLLTVQRVSPCSLAWKASLYVCVPLPERLACGQRAFLSMF